MSGQADGVDSLKIAYSYLAEHAKVEPTGLVSVVGGGLHRVQASEIPCPFAFFVVLQLVKTPDAHVRSTVGVHVSRSTGDIALGIDGEFEFSEGDASTWFSVCG